MVAKLNFQHHHLSLQCHIIFQKSFYYANLLLKNLFYLFLSVLKTAVVLLNIFMETMIHFLNRIEGGKNNNLLVFTVLFDTFKVFAE